MDKNLNYYDNTLTPFSGRPLSESVTIDTPNGGLSAEPNVRSDGHSRIARRRWAVSMHATYMVRMFESFIHNPFYSLVLSLRMFGLIINIESQNTRMFSSKTNQIRVWIQRILRYFLTAFMLIYILYYAIRTTSTVSYGGIWTNLKVLINSWITLWTVILFLIRHKQIGSLMVRIQSIHSFVSDRTPALKRKVMISMGGLWIYLVISVVTFFFDFSYVNSEDLFAVNYGGLQVSKTVATIIVYSDTILSVYFVWGTLIIIITTYILLCHSLECLFKDLKDFSIAQHKQNRELTLKGLRELKNRHQLLALYSEELDFIFSFMVFLWLILVVVSLCIRVNTVIAGEYSSANIEGWMASIWSIGITLLIYIGVSLSASALNYESVHSALNIEKLAISYSIKTEESFYYELILFLTRICVNPIELTCYRFFPIKKFLILIIALIVIAYYFFVVHYDLIVMNIKQ